MPSSGVADMYPMEYICLMIEIRQTQACEDWFGSLRDKATRARFDI